MKLKSISESAQDFADKLEQEYPELEDLWLRDDKYAVVLSNLRVRKDARSKGIGTEVIEKVKEYAKTVGKPLVLYAEPDKGKKTALQRFYNRVGFKKSGSRKDYRLPTHTHIWNG